MKLLRIGLVDKFRLYKAIRLTIATLIAVLVSLIFTKNPMLLLIAGLIPFQVGLIVNFMTKKETIRIIFVGGMTIVIFIAVGSYIGNLLLLLDITTIIAAFLTYYLMRYNGIFKTAVLSTATLDFYIFGTFHSNVIDSIYRLIFGTLSIVLMYIIYRYVWQPKKDLLYINITNKILKHHLENISYIKKYFLKIYNNKKLRKKISKKYNCLENQTFKYNKILYDTTAELKISKKKYADLKNFLILHYITIKKIGFIIKKIVCIEKHIIENEEIVLLIGKFLNELEINYICLEKGKLCDFNLENIRTIYNKLLKNVEKSKENNENCCNVFHVLFCFKDILDNLNNFYLLLNGGENESNN